MPAVSCHSENKAPALIGKLLMGLLMSLFGKQTPQQYNTADAIRTILQKLSWRSSLWTYCIIGWIQPSPETLTWIPIHEGALAVFSLDENIYYVRFTRHASFLVMLSLRTLVSTFSSSKFAIGRFANNMQHPLVHHPVPSSPCCIQHNREPIAYFTAHCMQLLWTRQHEPIIPLKTNTNLATVSSRTFLPLLSWKKSKQKLAKYH